MTVVDLSRRFCELTKSELEDSESLLSLADAGLLKSMSWADVVLHPRVVLLAEAGSGKTFEMRERARQLRAEGKPAFFLPLEALDEGKISDLLTVDDERAFNSWRTDERTLTIRAPELSVDIEYALGVVDSSLILPDWSEEKRQALLRKALFDPATYGRVKFHHRSVQEYLAARRLDELRKRGMSTKALCRLLFAERYGVPVVIPSMRPIAAWLALWNRHVQRELLRREPETLLSMGDPETLPIPIRAELLRAFAQSYGNGGWRGLRIPIEEVRRLAHPELGSVVLELWGQGPTNEDVRELLLDLMDQGGMQQCASVCEQAARDVNLPEHHHRASAVVFSESSPTLIGTGYCKWPATPPKPRAERSLCVDCSYSG